MPSQTTRRTLARQWELLKCLPSAGSGKSALALCAELAGHGFTVSKRQVERDLKDLAEIFPLDRHGDGVPVGWRWMAGANLHLPGLDVAEALSLHLVQAALQPLLPAPLLHTMAQRFQQAQSKLDSLGAGNALCRWQDKVRSLPAQWTLQAPAVDEAVVDAVHAALLADEQIQVAYRSMEREATTVLLHPLALIQRGAMAYLAATAWDYDDIRLYALHRMADARRMHMSSRRPPDFQVDEWLQRGAAQFGGRKPVRLSARVSPSLGHILAESPLAAGQRLRGDRLDVQVIDSWELRWWILSQSDGIEVLRPAALRREIGMLLHRAAARYKDASP